MLVSERLFLQLCFSAILKRKKEKKNQYLEYLIIILIKERDLKTLYILSIGTFITYFCCFLSSLSLAISSLVLFGFRPPGPAAAAVAAAVVGLFCGRYSGS